MTNEDKHYFNLLEKETKEKEKESATWGRKVQYYKFHCITSNIDRLAYTSDISNAGACVEALFRSHMHMAITTLQWCDTKMQPDFSMIIWIDWDLNKIKDHDQTTKTHMERVEDGQKKERKLHLLGNDGKAFFLSHALQAQIPL